MISLAKLVDVLGINSYWGWYDKVLGGKGLIPGDSHKAEALEREPIDLSAMRGMLDKILAQEENGLVLMGQPGYFRSGPAPHVAMAAFQAAEVVNALTAPAFSFGNPRS